MAGRRTTAAAPLLAASLVTCLLGASALSGILKPGQQYGQEFTSPEGESLSDIMVSAYSDAGGDVDLKCRPLTAEANSNWPWQSRLPAGTERLFISAYDPAFTDGGSDGNYGVFCMVENAATPAKPVSFEMDVQFTGSTPALKQEEQDALKAIYDRCCGDEDACRAWKDVDNQGEGGSGPFTDFCHMEKQGCDSRGRLVQLNMDGWGLRCAFPADHFAAFPALKVLRIGAGHEFSGDIGDVFDELATSVSSLELLHLSGNADLGGHLAHDGAGADAPVCRLAKALSLMQLAGNGISGSIPACLLDGSSMLAFIDVGMNRLTGPIPDNFWVDSPLTDLFVDHNQLTGSVPRTLGDLPYLHTFNASHNQLSGAIDRNVGSAHSLMQFFVAGNQLTGELPSSLGVHPNMTSIDVSGNQLDGLPGEWYNADDTMRAARLGSVKLNDNKFTGSVPVGLSVIPILTRLNLADNQFSGNLPVVEGAENFPNMLFYNVSNNAIEGPLPAEYGQMRLFSSEALGIVNPDGSRELFTFVFDVSGNDLTGEMPVFLDKKNVESSLKWTAIEAAGNDFSNKCAPEFEYTGACEEAPAEAPEGDDGGLSTGAIVGIVIGVLAGVALLVLVGVLVGRRMGGVPGVAVAMPTSSHTQFEKFEDSGPGS